MKFIKRNVFDKDHGCMPSDKDFIHDGGFVSRRLHRFSSPIMYGWDQGHYEHGRFFGHQKSVSKISGKGVLFDDRYIGKTGVIK